jgi:hypothetical protein
MGAVVVGKLADSAPDSVPLWNKLFGYVVVNIVDLVGHVGRDGDRSKSSHATKMSRVQI